MFCVCLVHNDDDCMKSVYLLLHVAIETVKLSTFMIDSSFCLSLHISVSPSVFLPRWRINVFIVNADTSWQPM